MKKLLTLLLTILMVFALVGCNSKQDTPVVQEPEKQEEVVEETKEEPEVVGGYVDVEDGTLTDELKDIFNSALDGLTGATYEPQELVATQVVAGTNYKFLANGSKTSNPITKGTYYITIYKDLEGNVKLLDIETIEEKQEEKKTVDKTKYKYWVVFYNPDGNELQRTIEKYGATPEYKGDTPVYWDSENWYKFTGWNKELKPITTNTYITAEYEYGGKLKKEEAKPVCKNTSTYLIKITSSEGSGSYNYYVYEYNSDTKTYVREASQKNGLFHPSYSLSVDNYYHSGFNDSFDDPGKLELCEHINTHTLDDACLAKGTMITMADGSRKPIEDLYEGDLIRVFDHNTGKVSSAKIMDYWQYEEKKSGLMTLHFTNDIDVNIVTGHGFYNKEKNMYVLLNASNVNSYVGKHFYNVDNDSWETLLGVTYSSKPVDTFFIATEGEFNAVAEGMLNVEDGIYYVLRNTFDFDNKMKVDEIKKANDIECYGLFDSTDFEYLTKEAFEKYGAANLKVALGKGIITKEQLDMIRAECITYESDNIVEEYIPENVQHSAR